MIFLLPLIILAAAGHCPYCLYDSCTRTEGSIPSCSQCYGLAALVPLRIKDGSGNQLASDIGVCQLCPDHCINCEYALSEPSFAAPRSVINCTKCQEGFATNHETGKCESCPANCDAGCEYQVVSVANSRPWGVIACKSCNAGTAYNYFTGGCLECPDNCSDCSCQLKGCQYLSCSACDEGFTLTPKANGEGNECV